MLAASTAGSNVSPDYVKPPPAAAFPALAADQFGENGPGRVADANPACPPEQDSARFEPSRTPFEIRIPHRDAAFGIEPQGRTIQPAPPQRDQFPRGTRAPQRRGSSTQRGRYGQGGDDERPRGGQRDSRPEYDPAQDRVRSEFG